MLEDIVLEEKVKKPLVVLVTPDGELGDTSQGFNHCIPVGICHNGVSDKHIPEEPEVLDREPVNWLRFGSS